jgi:hypothetical protein
MTVINSDNISSGYTSTTVLSGSRACIGYTQFLDVSSVVNTSNYFIVRLAPHSSPHTLNNWDTSFNVTAGVYLCKWSIYLNISSSTADWLDTGVINGTSTTPTSYTLTYNGQTYTNLYNSGTNYSNTGLGSAIVNNGSCVINTVGSLSKSFSLLCHSSQSTSINPSQSFFQYTRIA